MSFSMSFTKKAEAIAAKVNIASLVVPAPARAIITELVQLVIEMAQELDQLKEKK